MKKQIEELKVINWTLTSGMIGWGLLGVITLVTIVGPYLCYGYIKKFSVRKRANNLRIQDLQQRISQTSS